MKCVITLCLVGLSLSCSAPSRASRARSYDYAISDQTGQIAPEIVKTVEQAALSGDREGSMRLYHHYVHEKREKEALKWIRLGAVQGNTAAMIGLAGHLEDGHAAERAEAQCWQRIAYYRGDPTAKELYKHLFAKEHQSKHSILTQD
ncbi:hypothetical protein SAMN02745166_02091 [Prosthecobacter debontii]|uniref:Sel1 repeat-containing protein n=1 Tax=Prosthecobacter debontii TaxID=48467 RepID=A0A1T4XWE0_9BACT|nr:hypothetical protein [Prosthecobacter debontii]SKA93371.1 hypothetical protein SAMN02745166_02091 [Prosthecobacter debontii]